MDKAKRRKDDDSLISPSSMDKISDLPEPIMQHILGFLSQIEAVQTCVLSKSWRHVWRTRSVLELCQDLLGVDTETFVSFLGQTLERYHRQNLSIKRFVVKLSCVDAAELILPLEKWIPIVLINLGVETFHLIFPDPFDIFYGDLPSAPLIFQAEFLKELHLSGFKIKSTDDKICLNHLETLSLHKVNIKNEALERILASCPLIQRVNLYCCVWMTTVKANNLKHFGCVRSGNNFEIKAALESFKIVSSYILGCYLHYSNNTHFPHLKSLCLTGLHLSEDFSGSFSCNSPCMENFELKCCHGFDHVKILSRSVMRLVIEDMPIMSITVAASAIVSFKLSCLSSVPSVSFATVAAASRDWKSDISAPRRVPSSVWFLKLNEMLKALRQSQICLNLFCDTMRNQDIKDIVGYCEPIVVDHLGLWGSDSCLELAAMFNCLSPIFRPRYICVTIWYLEIKRLAELIWKSSGVKNGEFSRCYICHQELKELSIEILYYSLGKWDLVQWSSLPESTSIKEIKHVRYGFECGDTHI